MVALVQQEATGSVLIEEESRVQPHLQADGISERNDDRDLVVHEDAEGVEDVPDEFLAARVHPEEDVVDLAGIAEGAQLVNDPAGLLGGAWGGQTSMTACYYLSPHPVYSAQTGTGRMTDRLSQELGNKLLLT